jgi:hypothetical protein
MIRALAFSSSAIATVAEHSSDTPASMSGSSEEEFHDEHGHPKPSQRQHAARDVIGASRPSAAICQKPGDWAATFPVCINWHTHALAVVETSRKVYKGLARENLAEIKQKSVRKRFGIYDTHTAQGSPSVYCYSASCKLSGLLAVM